MAHEALIVALGMIAAASPGSATQPEPIPVAAPIESANARYCLRLEPVTGTHLELIRCWTRKEWAEQGVDVDKDWAEEGVAVLR